MKNLIAICTCEQKCSKFSITKSKVYTVHKIYKDGPYLNVLIVDDNQHLVEVDNRYFIFTEG